LVQPKREPSVAQQSPSHADDSGRFCLLPCRRFAGCRRRGSGLRLDVISLAPEAFRAAPGPWRDLAGPFGAGLAVTISHPTTPRDFSPPIATQVDDEPYGVGRHGAKPEPVFAAFRVEFRCCRAGGCC